MCSSSMIASAGRWGATAPSSTPRPAVYPSRVLHSRPTRRGAPWNHIARSLEIRGAAMGERLVVVDGYNVILRTPSLRPDAQRTLRESRTKLLNLLSWTIGSGEARFLVVFDGADGVGHEGPSGRVEVRFSRPPRTADDLIREIVEAEISRVARLTVVTSDLEVARHARAMGADI